MDINNFNINYKKVTKNFINMVRVYNYLKPNYSFIEYFYNARYKLHPLFYDVRNIFIESCGFKTLDSYALKSIFTHFYNLYQST